MRAVLPLPGYTVREKNPQAPHRIHQSRASEMAFGRREMLSFLVQERSEDRKGDVSHRLLPMYQRLPLQQESRGGT